MPEWVIEVIKLLGVGLVTIVLKGLYDLKFKRIDDRATLQTLLSEQVQKLKKISDEYLDDSEDYRGKYWDERKKKHEANERAQVFVWRAIETADVLDKLLLAEKCIEECTSKGDVEEARRVVARVRKSVDELRQKEAEEVQRRLSPVAGSAEG